MSEEIKEILDRLDFNEWEVDLYKVPITWSELYDIRDYITNLQKENENLKEIEYKFFYCSEDEESFILDDYLKIGNELYDCEEKLKDYKQRNEKAIEYIKNDLQISILPNNQIINGTEVVKRINKIANILQGGDE